MEHRVPVRRATSTRCRLGQVPSAHVHARNDRSVRDLLPIQSTVKYGGSARCPKVSQVTDIAGSGTGLDMSSGA